MRRLVTVVVAVMCTARVSAVENISITPDVVYGHKYGMALTMDVIQPTNGNGVGVLLIVSGEYVSWWMPPEAAMPYFQPLLDKGFTAFLVRHGSSPKYVVPEIVEDVRRCVRFVRFHAERFQVDPERLGVCGQSSGGHLALVLATMSDEGDPNAVDEVLRVSSRVAAVVSYYAPTDLRADVKEGNPIRERIPALRFDPNKAEDMSPLFHVSSDDSPALLIHGDKDPIVPIWHSEKMLEALRSKGVDSKLLVIEGAGHGFTFVDSGDAWVAWFEKHLLKTCVTIN